MPLRDELLNPIAGDNPGGADVRYDPLFDKIKEARREDVDAPQGEWKTTPKTADWNSVIRLATETLGAKSKDLQLAVWLTEALLHRQGLAGLHDGLDVLAGLVEQFWDHLYPEIDDGDAEMRAAPLDWLGGRLDAAVRLVPIDRSGMNLIQLREARTVPDEASTLEDFKRLAVRDAAIAEGKSTPEQVEASFQATSKADYRKNLAEAEAALAALERLDAVSGEKFGNVAPSFAKLRDALADVIRTLNQQIKRKLETDPDPIEVVTAQAAADGETSSTSGAAGGGVGGALTAEPTSEQDAAARIASAAKFLRQYLPLNPAPYLLLRGYRWGELRAAATIDPRLLEAPQTHIRSNLKGMLLDNRWPELLEAAEMVMATPQGRGWLDLQRYVLTACEGLGVEYAPVATAIRAALRSLLADVPQLVDMTLMDDTATANVETRGWLKSAILAGAPAQAELDSGDASEYDGGAAEALRHENALHAGDPVAIANGHVRAGRSERAIALLMKESSREKSRRGRFVLQSQLARVMVDAGHNAVAVPILEGLVADIEAYKLEEWETGELVATPMALLFRCIEKTGGDDGVRQALYLRICKLDPIQAIGLGQA